MFIKWHGHENPAFMFLLSPLLDDKMDSPHKWYCDYIGATTGGNKAVMFPSCQGFPSHWNIFSEDFNNSLSLYCRVKSLDTVTPSYSYRTYYQMLIEAYVFAGIHRQSPDMRISSGQLTDSLQLSEPLQFVNYIIFLTQFSLYFCVKKKVPRSKPINTTWVNCRLIRFRIAQVCLKMM